jgi:hypothetical protein
LWHLIGLCEGCAVLFVCKVVGGAKEDVSGGLHTRESPK